MLNSSQVSQFTLGAYSDTGPLRWLYFFLIMSVYVLILLSNLLLIVVICFNTTLHQPMYIFLCSLFINEIYGSTALFPFLLFQIPKDVHTVSYSLCLLQIFCIYSYGAVNFTNLAVMSYDRYVAICFPLQYHSNMSSNKVVFLVVLIWIPPFVGIGISVLLTASLRLCGDLLDTVYCDNYPIVKLACVASVPTNMYEVTAATITVVVCAGVIVFTYVQILRVCFSGCKETRQKALSTCTPHLCSLINFSLGGLFQIFQARFNMNHLPQILRIFLSVYHLTVQPLFNSVMYGLNLSKIRNGCKELLLKHKNKIIIK